MESKYITKENGFDIDYNKGRVVITNSKAIELLNVSIEKDYDLHILDGLVPNHKVTIEEQIIGIVYG